MSVEIRINSKPVEDMLEKAAKNIPMALQRTQANLLEDIYEESQKLVPVRTGTLRDSGYMTSTPTTGMVGYGAEYSVHVERGTSRMAPRLFLWRSFEKYRAQLENYMRKMWEWLAKQVV